MTKQAQQAVGQVLRPGERAVDATVGNGHDTLFLARQVVPGGRVIGFDVQPRALATAQTRLAASGLQHIVELQLCGHQQMRDRVPVDWPGRVGAVMFNLGYLPGGDKQWVTRAEHTLPALDQALHLLRVGGLVSLLVYRGHPGAQPEADALTVWLGGLDARYRVTGHASPGPLLYLIGRLA